MLKKFCLENWKSIVWMTIAGFAMTTYWVPPWSSSLASYLKVGSFTSCLWISLWLGNGYTANLVSNRLSWTEQPVQRFVAGMIVMIVYTLGAVFTVIYLYEVVFGMSFRGDINDVIISTLSITFIISFFMHGRSFLNNWKEAELNAERLQKESVKAQYDSLKNQVNPHFLFNSMNALTNLIYEDQDKAAKFVKQLSEVYRYVLDTQGKELVPLDDELKFLNSYLFLQQIRFGDKLRAEINLTSSNIKVAPLVLQMLVENAIKHNIISSDLPLTIRIFEEGEFLVVQNNLQRKKVLVEESGGIGLENIKKRYEFLTSEKISVHESDMFTVKIPSI